MEESMVIQGRSLNPRDIGMIQDLLAEHGDWGRTRLSQELCRLWDWRNGVGRIKDMAARTLLLKLERMGRIQLPAPLGKAPNGFLNRDLPLIAHDTSPIRCPLADLQPLSVEMVSPHTPELPLFNCLLNCYHYLGHRNTVGENIRYLLRDRVGRPVACLLFGSAAWKCAARDAFIGWAPALRERNLPFLTNNTRFLILPWVTVPHLASHILSSIVRRIRSDWQAKYGHPLYALETFVDRDRFQGTCYRAANWQPLGMTQGRTRNDRQHSIRVSAKEVYLYPLIKNFRRGLCG